MADVPMWLAFANLLLSLTRCSSYSLVIVRIQTFKLCIVVYFNHCLGAGLLNAGQNGSKTPQNAGIYLKLKKFYWNFIEIKEKTGKNFFSNFSSVFEL